MFLKQLTIQSETKIIRTISFRKGMNLIIDETPTDDKKKSGNNVGKTTVLRLIDYCLGGDGKNVYQDSEFKGTSNQTVKSFLQENNIIIILDLKKDLEIVDSPEIQIRRNFLSHSKKIQEINSESYNSTEFLKELQKFIFSTEQEKPTFRQIISKNIRYEKNRLTNTVKVLHATTTWQEYEALYLFWLGIDTDNSSKKQLLLTQKKVEENLQKRLRKDTTLSQINQSLIVVNKTIQELEKKKNDLNVNEDYSEDLEKLNLVKSEINKATTKLSRLELRKDLILESKRDLESDSAKVNAKQIANLYKQAEALVPNLQKTFEETVTFHNRMIDEKISYITKELPELDADLHFLRRKLDNLLSQERQLTNALKKTNTIDDLQAIITDLNTTYERKGSLEEQKRLWESSSDNLRIIKKEIQEIDKNILSKDELIQARIATFNSFFSEISNRLYGEQFVLSADRNERGYELNVSSISGNLGTGKKKGQIAAFDLAYIQFADFFNITCLHFILHDQIETVHGNQILSLITEIVSEVNCQYVISVLRDKLPENIDLERYQILSLSQSDKLFRI